jgi:AAA15 family ATPase/GTPase
MFIESLSVSSHESEWQIEEIQFQPFTLLVGASGVGKSQILNAIFQLSRMSNGSIVNHWDWNIVFCEKANKYQWKGSASNNKTDDLDFQNFDYSMINYESLLFNDQIVLKRDIDTLYYKDQKIPMLSASLSALSMISELEFKGASSGLAKIQWGSFEDYSPYGSPSFNPENVSRYTNIETIRVSKHSLLEKLYYAYSNCKEIFNAIKERYLEIFPEIEDLRIDMNQFQNNNNPIYTLQIEIKPVGVSRWINQREISSGMLRSLYLLADIHLCQDGSVILIDEFENGLGVNCMDAIIAEMQNAQRGLQFIITSHHPYIINSVDFQHWKLVTRNGGVISTHAASEFNLGKSRHKAFTQLINLEAYQTGRMPGETHHE